MRVERGEATGIEGEATTNREDTCTYPSLIRHGRVYHAWMYAGGVVYARSLHEADALAETWGMTRATERWCE